MTIKRYKKKEEIVDAIKDKWYLYAAKGWDDAMKDVAGFLKTFNEEEQKEKTYTRMKAFLENEGAW